MSPRAASGPVVDQDVSSPQRVVEAFLDAMADSDLGAALALVDDDIAYTNVSLPTIRGKRRLEKALRGLDRPQFGFEVSMHSIATEGSTVLTERTDVLIFGAVRVQLWVCGRFDVANGQITLWRDYFDWFDLAKGLLRGLLGAAVPGWGREPPPR